MNTWGLSSLEFRCPKYGTQDKPGVLGNHLYCDGKLLSSDCDIQVIQFIPCGAWRLTDLLTWWKWCDSYVTEFTGTRVRLNWAPTGDLSRRVRESSPPQSSSNEMREVSLEDTRSVSVKEYMTRSSEALPGAVAEVTPYWNTCYNATVLLTNTILWSKLAVFDLLDSVLFFVTRVYISHQLRQCNFFFFFFLKNIRKNNKYLVQSADPTHQTIQTTKCFMWIWDIYWLRIINPSM